MYSDHRGQKGNKIALELELKSVVSQMTWVLGSKPWLFKSHKKLLTAEPSLSFKHFLNFGLINLLSNKSFVF